MGANLQKLSIVFMIYVQQKFNRSKDQHFYKHKGHLIKLALIRNSFFYSTPLKIRFHRILLKKDLSLSSDNQMKEASPTI